jgi:hypothetical protein
VAQNGQKRVQNRSNIWNELKEISPLVAEINSREVYMAPPGYFELLADIVMQRIHAQQPGYIQHDTMPAALVDFNKNLPHAVPEGYFEGFAEKMINRIRKEQNLSASEEIKSIAPFLAGLDKKMPFSLPDGYFEDFTVLVETRLLETMDQQKTLSPLLVSLKSENVYELPVGYFDGFAGSVMAAIKKPQQAKIVPFYRKRNWLRVAAAAAMVAIIATIGLLYVKRPFSNSGSDLTGQSLAALSKVSDQEMLNYLEVQSTPPLLADAGSIASVDINDADARDLLSDVPDDELQQYMDGQSNLKDPVTN